MNKALLQKRIVFLILALKTITILVLMLMYWLGGLDFDEILKIVYICTPTYILYTMTAFIFIKKNRYLPKSSVVLNKMEILIYLGLLLLIFTLTISIIIYFALYKSIADETFYGYLCFFGSISTAYAAMILSKFLNGKAPE